MSPHISQNAAAAAKSLQLCPTLCDRIDGSPPGSSVLRILQARILEWVAISSSNAFMHAKSLQSCLTLCDPWTAAHQAPLSTEFSRQEYWSGLPFPSPPVRMAIIKNLQTINAGEDVGKREHSLLHYWWECKLLQPWEQYGDSFKNLGANLPHDRAIPLLDIHPEKATILFFSFTEYFYF